MWTFLLLLFSISDDFCSIWSTVKNWQTYFQFLYLVLSYCLRQFLCTLSIGSHGSCSWCNVLVHLLFEFNHILQFTCLIFQITYILFLCQYRIYTSITNHNCINGRYNASTWSKRDITLNLSDTSKMKRNSRACREAAIIIVSLVRICLHFILQVTCIQCPHLHNITFLHPGHHICDLG